MEEDKILKIVWFISLFMALCLVLYAVFDKTEYKCEKQQTCNTIF